jgi:alkanesulfonate monooxygenase SsuD/methylene tetrahydromethanopterin reductase-like flavin-dependent oxidoreductase (luciferase family)
MATLSVLAARFSGEEAAMRFAVDISPAGRWGTPVLLAELAALAEDSGWDGVFCEDYLAFADRLDTYDVWITLGLMASATERVTLASIVTPLAWRQPWTVAAQATTVDQISRGRFVLGVGIGDNAAAEGSRFRAPMSDRERASRVDEALEVIAALWSGEPVSRNGEFHLEQAELLPRPVARPRIPIWIGGALTRPGPRARALRWDGACLYRIPGGWEDVTAGDVRQLRSDGLNRAETANPFTIVVGGRLAKTTSPPKSATSEPSPWLEPTGGTSTSHPASASKRPVSAYDVDR